MDSIIPKVGKQSIKKENSLKICVDKDLILKKSDLHYARGITASGRGHSRLLRTWVTQEETSQLWRALDDTVPI